MSRDVIIYPIVTARHVPDFIRESRLMMAIYNAEDKALATELFDINRLLASGFIDTIDNPLLAKLEQWWHITVPVNATLEDRRTALKAKMAAKTIYTKRSLHKMLTALCGPDNFELFIDSGKYYVKVLIELKSKNQMDTVKLMLHDVLPANMIYDVLLRYNQHSLLHKLTHAEMAAFSHEKLRTGAEIKELVNSKG